MRYRIDPPRSIIVLLVFIASFGFTISACSSNISNNRNAELDAGEGGQCGNAICSFDEDEFTCPQDCAPAARCGDTCGADGRIHFCDENGNDDSFACPESFGSTCILDSIGFPVCSCGTISSLGTCYEDNSIGVDLAQCENGIAQLYYCLEGAFCDDDGDSGASCFCDDRNDGICPDAACTNDPDCSQCTPNCNGNVCGSNGCGGDCGSCSPSQTCQSGSCVASCTPSCSGRECGSDGCGGTCSPGCSGQATCDDGQCIDGVTGPNYSYTISSSPETSISVSPSGQSASNMICEVDGGKVDIYLNSPGSKRYLFHVVADWASGQPCDPGTTPTYDVFAVTEFLSDNDFRLYKVGSSLNELPSLVLNCEINNGQISASLFSGSRLYRNGAPNTFPNDWVAISQGNVLCDINTP